jgi:hypothetical protein
VNCGARNSTLTNVRSKFLLNVGLPVREKIRVPPANGRKQRAVHEIGRHRDWQEFGNLIQRRYVQKRGGADVALCAAKAPQGGR